jgi:hypothetical protein
VPLPNLKAKQNKEENKMAKKEFNLKLYSIFAVILVAVIISTLTVYAFTTRYTAFDAEKMAVAFVDTIVQTGDGYSAYKDTLLSKDDKFGDYIRKYYLYPEIYEGYTVGADTDSLKGLDDKTLKNDADTNDDGTLEGKVIDTMYPYFLELITSNNGFDNYDEIFRSYITELKSVRAEVYGDTYFDDEAFFTAFEANLATYGESLTGTEDVFDSNTGVQTKYKSTGTYQEKYGDDYKITVESLGAENTEIPDMSTYETDVEPTEAKTVKINVLVNDEIAVDGIEITVVKIGKSWYVANNSCDTSILYNFYK